MKRFIIGFAQARPVSKQESQKAKILMCHKSINLRAAIPLIIVCFGLPLAVKAQENVTLLGGSPAMDFSRELLKRADVRNELGIDANQEEALAKVLSESAMPIVVRPVVQYRDISKLSIEERKQWQAEINRQAAKDAAFIMNERRREVEEILRPDQRKRLTEIDLQWRGILALVDRGLSNKLGILPSHCQVIQQIVAEFKVKRLGLLSVEDRADLYQKRQVLLGETEQKILSVLSDEEKRRWSQTIGRPFRFEANLTKY